MTRSSHLMNRHDTALLVIDVQEKLMTKIHGRDRVLSNIERLVQAAKVLDLFVQATEQYPEGLGPTVASLSKVLPPRLGKIVFSCAAVPEVGAQLKEKRIGKVLLAGVEAHVCVQQTALDLMEMGLKTYVAVDAVGSRHEEDRVVALRRLEASGAILTTTEAAIFEWTERAGTPEFKRISQMIKEAGTPKP